MTKFNKQYMYNESRKAMLNVSVWANFVVSIYQDCNIDRGLKTRG